MTLIPDQEWWTPAEIAARKLPDLPTNKRGVAALAKSLNWKSATKFARRRPETGDWEYHWKLFPNAAQRVLLKQAIAPKAAAARARDAAWARYEAQPEVVKARAQARLDILERVEALIPTLGHKAAISQVADAENLRRRTIRIWLSMIRGIARQDRLAYLVPTTRPNSDTAEE